MFNFVNAVAEMQEFIPMVEEFWNSTDPIFLSTSSLYRFSKKLKALKPLIRALAKENMGNLVKGSKEAYKELCEKQEENSLNPMVQTMENENRAYKRWENVSWLEESFLKQKCKLHWIQVGDQVTNHLGRMAIPQSSSKWRGQW